METYRLIAHEDFPPLEVSGVTVSWSQLPGGRQMLRYRVDGCGQLAVPEFAGKGRAGKLWETTCFELFLQDTGGAYREFNFSPSQRWAAYGFDRYREGQCDCEVIVAPEVVAQLGEFILICTVFFDGGELRGAARAGLSAVLEETGGRKSYWALAHPEGKPDFHDPACFAASLPAPDAP